MDVIWNKMYLNKSANCWLSVPWFIHSRPPNGCLQYWTTLVGRFTTFNFLSSTGPNLPANRCDWLSFLQYLLATSLYWNGFDKLFSFFALHCFLNKQLINLLRTSRIKFKRKLASKCRESNLGLLGVNPNATSALCGPSLTGSLCHYKMGLCKYIFETDSNCSKMTVMYFD